MRFYSHDLRCLSVTGMLIQPFSRSGTELPEKEVTEESFIVFSGEKTPRKKPFSCSVFIQFSSGCGGG